MVHYLAGEIMQPKELRFWSRYTDKQTNKHIRYFLLLTLIKIPVSDMDASWQLAKKKKKKKQELH